MWPDSQAVDLLGTEVPVARRYGLRCLELVESVRPPPLRCLPPRSCKARKLAIQQLVQFLLFGSEYRSCAPSLALWHLWLKACCSCTLCSDACLPHSRHAGMYVGLLHHAHVWHNHICHVAVGINGERRPGSGG